MKLANPFKDSSDPAMWPQERRILRRLLAGDELIARRTYDTETRNCAVSWYWDSDDGFCEQVDYPVMLLLGRQAVRPVRVNGGRTWMVLTEAGKAAAKKLTTDQGKT